MDFSEWMDLEGEWRDARSPFTWFSPVIPQRWNFLGAQKVIKCKHHPPHVQGEKTIVRDWWESELRKGHWLGGSSERGLGKGEGSVVGRLGNKRCKRSGVRTWSYHWSHQSLSQVKYCSQRKGKKKSSKVELTESRNQRSKWTPESKGSVWSRWLCSIY